MRIVRPEDMIVMSLDEPHCHWGWVHCGGGATDRKNDKEDFNAKQRVVHTDEDDDKKLVCVTSGVSYLGITLIKQLLCHGYFIRVIMDDKEEDIAKLNREIEIGKMGMIEVVLGKLTDFQLLVRAFEGCCGVFHTCAFSDPAGISGYTKSMADVEVMVAENVMNVCTRTPSLTKCVFTSSLLACIWRNNSTTFSLVNHDSWSDESTCMDKKLWLALGKLRAEKVAWRIARENDQSLKLATICPALVTGTDFINQNLTPTIAYLKGGVEMFSSGLLATVDVKRLAEAHVRVFDAMNNNMSSGRYICFDHILDEEEEAQTLAMKLRMPVEKLCSSEFLRLQKFQLSDKKLSVLMSTTQTTCYSEKLNFMSM